MARLFNGSSDGAFASAIPVTGMPLTLSGWIKINNFGADDHNVLALSTASNLTSYGIVMRTAGTARARQSNQSGIAMAATTSTSITSTGVWVHVAGVFASAIDRAVYLNGGGKGTNTTDPGGSSTALNTTSFGARAVNNTFDQFVNGYLKDLAVWNAALTDNEVAALSNGVSPLHVRSNALVEYIPIVGRGNMEMGEIQHTPFVVRGSLGSTDSPMQLSRPSGSRIYSFAPAGAPPPPSTRRIILIS
jgi:hypothetical protein